MDISIEEHYGEGDHWSLTFISERPEFTEDDLTAVRHKVELSGIYGRALLPLSQHDRRGGGPTGSYRGSWSRKDGWHRTNRIVVSCTGGQRPGPAALAYHVLQQRYPSARFTTYNGYLRQTLNDQGLGVIAP